jgi:N-dimethylarginine dimethylaminohydrolase
MLEFHDDKLMTIQPHILMCPPDFYGIEYEINPWMHRSAGADRPLAIQQWQDLKGLLETAGAKISLLTPQPGLPDMVFTANAAVIHRRTAILAHFRYPQRQGEESHNAAWLQANGFEVQKLPDERFFEGAGDALYCGETLVAGYRTRSDALSMQLIGELLACRVLPLEMVDTHYYHLDTCFCPLAPGVAIYYPGAFDDYGRRVLAEAVPELIEVAADEAASFACNAVVVGQTVVTNVGCPKLHAALRARAFKPVATPLGEFVKAGGSAKCLTLRLDGEEAAQWKQAG